MVITGALISNLIKKITIIAFFLMTLAGFSWWAFLNIGGWLSLADPETKSDVIICLSGEPERVKTTASLYNKNLSPEIILTLERWKKPLLRLDVPSEKVTVVPDKPTSTLQEVTAVAPVIRANKYKTIMVVSDSYHLYRVRWLFTHEFKETDIKFLFIASGASWTKGFWWDNLRSRLFVLNEIPKIAFSWIAVGIFNIKKDPKWAEELGDRYKNWLYRVFTQNKKEYLAPQKGNYRDKDNIIRQ